MQLPPDEGDLAPQKPKHPCLVCGTPTDIRPVCERFQLCLPCLGDWFEDPRYRGGDLEQNAAKTPAWIEERKAALRAGAA